MPEKESEPPQFNPRTILEAGASVRRSSAARSIKRPISRRAASMAPRVAPLDWRVSLASRPGKGPVAPPPPPPLSKKPPDSPPRRFDGAARAAARLQGQPRQPAGYGRLRPQVVFDLVGLASRSEEHTSELQSLRH